MIMGIKKHLMWLIPSAFLVANAAIVFFGRIYYPANFVPTEVTFFENYWVLCLGELFCAGMFSIAIAMFCVLVVDGIAMWKRLKS